MAFSFLKAASVLLILIITIYATQLILVNADGENNGRKFGFFGEGRRTLSPPPPPTHGMEHGMIPPEPFR
ncbi:hypothetical protein FNV43_RR26680 [Rhamnella rubrinervis]|uniref:Uncharacterized protein n=1 Tax=Rhamnella rubrinervis TaxID=2594499 RepID=A0A8K0DPS5_9ROSA|nr:hypothetical protein FNV43_RR26680 [Rhamnella rubrinervis]